MFIRRMLMGFSLASIAIWSVFCLGLWASFAYGTDLLHWLLFGSSEGASAPGGAFGLFQGIGGFLIFLFWGVGAAVMGAAMLIFRKLQDGPVIVVRTFEGRTLGGWGDPPMRDVTPPRDQPARPEQGRF
jgi:hypothetical protein